MKIDFKKLIINIAVPLGVGALSALISMGSMDSFASLSKPPLSPPAWLFPVVWTVLYLMMNILLTYGITYYIRYKLDQKSVAEINAELERRNHEQY